MPNITQELPFAGLYCTFGFTKPSNTSHVMEVLVCEKIPIRTN